MQEATEERAARGQERPEARLPPGLTLYDVLGGYGLLLGLVADLVGLGGDEVDELRAAVYHQLPGVVRHADVGQRLLDHLVDGSPGDGQVVVVPRRGGHAGCRAQGLPLASSAGGPGEGRRAGKGRGRRWASGARRAGRRGGARGSALLRPRRLPRPPPPHPSGAGGAASGAAGGRAAATPRGPRSAGQGRAGPGRAALRCAPPAALPGGGGRAGAEGGREAETL